MPPPSFPHFSPRGPTPVDPGAAPQASYPRPDGCDLYCLASLPPPFLLLSLRTSSPGASSPLPVSSSPSEDQVLAGNQTLCGHTIRLFIPPRPREPIPPRPVRGACSKRQEDGQRKGWASSSPATPATHAPRPWASPPFCHYPSPCTRSRPSLSLWQASGLRASALGRCLLGDPRVGMSSNKGPLCLPTCCPPEHIPFLSGS